MTSRIFSKEVQTLHVWVRVLPEDNWIKASQQRLKKGYMYPKIGLLDKCEGPSRSISAIRFISGEKDKLSPFIIGDIKISTRRMISWNDGESRPDPVVPHPGNQLLYEWPEWLKIYGDAPSIELKDQAEIGQLLEHLLTIYPRYHQKRYITREQIIEQHRQLLSKRLPSPQYYEELTKILLLLEDSHFKIVGNKTSGPNISANDAIKFYRIDDRVVVAGVFDPGLRDRVSPGDEVKAIGNIGINDYIQKKMKSVYGSSRKVRERLILENLLHLNNQAERQRVTLKRTDGTIFTFEHCASDSFERIVPSNFLRSRFHYRDLGKYSYIRIGQWNKSTWPFFYSHLDSLRKSKGLIIDLRSNPGGDLSILRLIPCFIDRPSRVLSYYYRNMGDEVKHIVVNPYPLFQYKEPVVVLADSRTACASELFISALKRHYKSKCLLVSQGATSGAVQIVWSAHLGGGNRISFPYIAYDAFGLDLEGRGIEPDVYVDLTSYLDLAPYKDKLLSVGLDLLYRLSIAQ